MSDTTNHPDEDRKLVRYITSGGEVYERRHPAMGDEPALYKLIPLQEAIARLNKLEDPLSMAEPSTIDLAVGNGTLGPILAQRDGTLTYTEVTKS